jgi:glycosyltransferase involved in cell wall biosynthesis
MNILFLAHRAPTTPDRGDRIRSFHVLRHLSTRARVHVVAFDEGEAPRPDLPIASWTVIPRTKSRPRALAEALATGKPVSLTAFADPALTAAVAATPYDRVYCFSGQMAQHVPAGAPLVMDFVDVDSAKFAQLAADRRGPMAWLYAREARLLACIEREIAARADASLFVSEAEADLFRAQGGSGHIDAIGNGIDACHFDPAIVAPAPGAAVQGPLVVFTGQMDYQPNIDARPWLAAAAACVAPLDLARGVQNKVLEAMAMARPVLVTPAAAEGIDHGGTIRVAPRETFAGALTDLLAAPGNSGRAARARVLARYDWSARLAPLDALLGLARAEAA